MGVGRERTSPPPSHPSMLKNAFSPQQGGEISLNIKVPFCFSMQQRSAVRERAAFEADAIIRVLSGAVPADLPGFRRLTSLKLRAAAFMFSRLSPLGTLGRNKPSWEFCTLMFGIVDGTWGQHLCLDNRTWKIASRVP